MNSLTLAHNKKWLLVGMLLLALLLAACGGSDTTTEEPTEADAETVTETEEPTEEAEAEPTEAEEIEEEPTAVPVVEFDGVIADNIPCDAMIVPAEQSTLEIRFREPTTNMELMIGRVRPETAIGIIEMREVDGVVWYRTLFNNTFFGWIEAQYIVLGEDCVTGAGAADSDDAEATEEMDDAAEATEEATEEADE